MPAINFCRLEKYHLLTELNHFTLKTKSKEITLWSFKALLLSNGKLQGHIESKA